MPLPVLIGLKPCGFRNELAGWIMAGGHETFVTATAREAVRWTDERPYGLSFVDRDLGREDGLDVWRVVRREARHRLVLLAERKTNDLWFSALAEGVGTVLPLPAERGAVLTALRLLGRG